MRYCIRFRYFDPSDKQPWYIGDSANETNIKSRAKTYDDLNAAYVQCSRWNITFNKSAHQVEEYD